MTVQPSAISARAGGAPQSVSVSLAGRNGYTGAADVTITGMPDGVTTSPALLKLLSGQSSAISLQVPRTLNPGTYTSSVTGRDGWLTASAVLTLTITPAATFALTIGVGQGGTIVLAHPAWPSDSVVVGVVGQNEFADSVTLKLSGGPQGTLVSPASHRVAAGGQAVFRVTAPQGTMPADFPLTITGQSAEMQQVGSATLRVVSNTRTFREGRLLVLERFDTGVTTRIGLDSLWGALVVEASANGVSPVDRNDPGRGIGLSFSDASDLQYLPVQGGDVHLAGSPRSVTTLMPDGIAITVRPLLWNPEPYGGGPGSPVNSDMIVDQILTAVSTDVHLFRLQYRATYQGSVDRGFREHEFPCVYLGFSYNRLVYYAGNAPWTGGAVSDQPLTKNGSIASLYVAREKWAALVNADDFGITLWTPTAYPYFRGTEFTEAHVNYLVHPSWINFGPNRVVEQDAYIYVGDYKAARAVLSQIRGSVPLLDGEVPRGNLEQPAAGAVMTGTINVTGWVFDNVGVTRIEVLVNGQLVASGSGPTIPRPDVVAGYPYAPSVSGFSVPVNTAGLANGAGLLGVRAYDAVGNVLVMTARAVIIQN